MRSFILWSIVCNAGDIVCCLAVANKLPAGFFHQWLHSPLHLRFSCNLSCFGLTQKVWTLVSSRRFKARKWLKWLFALIPSVGDSQETFNSRLVQITWPVLARTHSHTHAHKLSQITRLNKQSSKIPVYFQQFGEQNIFVSMARSLSRKHSTITLRWTVVIAGSFTCEGQRILKPLSHSTR